jgi:hypothetical protein
MNLKGASELSGRKRVRQLNDGTASRDFKWEIKSAPPALSYSSVLRRLSEKCSFAVGLVDQTFQEVVAAIFSYSGNDATNDECLPATRSRCARTQQIIERESED